MVCSMGLKPGAGRLIASLKFEATFSVSSFWLQFVQLLSCFMHIYLKVLIAGGCVCGSVSASVIWVEIHTHFICLLFVLLPSYLVVS